jgi:rod shape determining protein RodA
MRQRTGTLANIDWILVGMYLLLVLLGWGNIYAAVYNEEASSILDISQKYGKQMLWILTSVVLIFIILIMDSSIYETLAFPIYGISILSLLAVLVVGTEIAGARSWFTFGGFSIQPSEFAKFAAVLALAKFLSTKGVSVENWRGKLGSMAIILLPAILIIPQPDPGSALVYTSLLLVLYRVGLSGNYIFIALALVILFILSLLVSKIALIGSLVALAVIMIFLLRKNRAWIWRISAVLILCVGVIQSVDYAFNNILEDRHRNRINILLGKAHDPQGIGYNTNQSMIAIGSGGFNGKGYLKGTQTKFDFVPEQSTDFIFCTVGEEWGFLGSSAVIILFTLFLFRLIIVAERQKSLFSRVYGYGVASIIFFHFAVNIAMTIGLAPVIGIPLPFFSYGGSSLWGFTLLLFIFIKLDSSRMQLW